MDHAPQAHSNLVDPKVYRALRERSELKVAIRLNGNEIKLDRITGMPTKKLYPVRPSASEQVENAEIYDKF